MENSADYNEVLLKYLMFQSRIIKSVEAVVSIELTNHAVLAVGYGTEETNGEVSENCADFALKWLGFRMLLSDMIVSVRGNHII